MLKVSNTISTQKRLDTLYAQLKIILFNLSFLVIIVLLQRYLVKAIIILITIWLEKAKLC